MIDSRWRGRFQPGFDFIGKAFVKVNMTPNTITIWAFIIGLLSALSLAQHFLITALILLWLSGLLDVIDGSVARLTGTSSKAGALLDLILDRMVEAAVILGFAWYDPSSSLAYLIFFTAVIFNFSTFLAAGALFDNTGTKSMHYDVGVAERTETFLVFTLMALFPNFIYQILMTFNMIIFFTGIIRFVRIIKYLQCED